MKKLALVFALATVAFGCGKPAANTGNVSNKGNTSTTHDGDIKVADGKIDKGDRVIIPVNIAKGRMFNEGEVLSLEGSHARVVLMERNASGVYTTGLSNEDAEVSEMYEAPGTGTKTEVKAGDIVIAKGYDTSKYITWYPGEVVKIDDLGVTVQGLGSSKQLLLAKPDSIIKPSEQAIAEFKQKGEDSQLLSAAFKHKPVMVEGYKPKAGDKVLAEPNITGFFNSGVITKAMKNTSGGDIVFIKWDDPRVTSKEQSYRLLPLASAAKQATPAVGRYLLVKPPTSGGQWLYAKVTAVNGQAVEVKAEDGTTQTVNPGEFWLLEENER